MALILKILKKKWQGNLLIVLSFLFLYLLSTPQIAYYLTSPLEEKVHPLLNTGGAQAIVILGGGQRNDAPEYGGQSAVRSPTLMRLGYGAYLYRKTNLPILVTGGKLLDDKSAEAKVMERALKETFGISARWVEELSQNTLENAQLSSEILKSYRLSTVILVTEAWHMRRAMLAFSSTGLKVLPAPTNFQDLASRSDFLNWLPHAESLSVSSRALHEWIGYIWYRIVIP